jgi:hypothetical protein
MMLGDVAAGVVAVLTRAESLFAVPEDAAAASGAADQLGQAAEANRALGGRSAELSGAGAAGHRQLVDDSAAGVAAAARADEQLAAHLTAAAARHNLGRITAQNLRMDAAALPDQFAALSGTAAGELAALKNLRTHLAGMQQLLAEHAGQDAAAAARIRALDYRR